MNEVGVTPYSDIRFFCPHPKAIFRSHKALQSQEISPETPQHDPTRHTHAPQQHLQRLGAPPQRKENQCLAKFSADTYSGGG